ncbi:MAG TPA: circadian clock KaiB family protein [Nitrospirales bacterium]|nr:circadian clock protein KaiB [Nitrospiraceae bacterium]HNP27940.1 circadian clock KaiB family protein [Nitrospirales bacterium]
MKKNTPKTSRSPKGHAAKNSPYHLTLYVAGHSPKSRLAMSNLKHLCETHLSSRYTVEIVDLLREPKRARLDQIVAIPTLVKKLPPPFKKIIGDLSNIEKVLVGLDLYDESGEVIVSSSVEVSS